MMVVRAMFVMLAAAMLSAAPLAAQTGPGAAGAPPAPDPFAIVADDSLMVLVEYRPAAEISQDLSDALSELALAEQKLIRAKLLLVQAESRIKLKEAEIASLKVQEDLANHEQNELRKKEFEARKRQAENEKQMLQKRHDLRRREIGVAEALRDYHKASAAVYERELDLATRREQRMAIAGRPVSVAVQQEFARIEVEVRDAEKKTLEAQVKAANEWKDVANREAELVKARKSLFDSQVKVEQGR